MWKTKRSESRAKIRFLLYSLILAAVATSFAGCSTLVAGRLQSSPEVTDMFEGSQILPNHQYYVSGFQTVPYAIIAVDNQYQLRTSRWQPIDMDPTSLNQLVYRMGNVYSLNPRGAWILDQEGNRLGAWYSSHYQTLVKQEKDGRIVVVSPDSPDLRGVR